MGQRGRHARISRRARTVARVNQAHITQGQAKLRAVLYMAALVASRCNLIIAAFYQRLLDAGKVKKVDLVACMRKLITILNAMMRTMIVWKPETILKRVFAEA